MAPAPARRRRKFVRLRPRQRRVAPFAGDRVGPFEHAAVDRHAAPATSAEDRGEHDPPAGGGAAACFRESETVRVIDHAHRRAELRAHVLAERPVVEPDAVGVADQPGFG